MKAKYILSLLLLGSGLTTIFNSYGRCCRNYGYRYSYRPYYRSAWRSYSPWGFGYSPYYYSGFGYPGFGFGLFL